jgi:hypothetical protein
MLKLWRLVCLTDTNLFICFTLKILRRIEKNIQECDEEGLNTLLKFQLKALVDGLNIQTLLEESVYLYLNNFLDPPAKLCNVDAMDMGEAITHNRTTFIPASII